MGPKLRYAFRKDGGNTFSDIDWTDHIWMGSSKSRFFFARRIWELRKLVQDRHQGDRSSDVEGSTRNHVAKDDDSFQVDLRIQRVSQDAANNGQERMTNIQKLVDKL